MLAMFCAGIITVLAALLALARLNLRRWLGYSTGVDIAFTLLMIVLLHGTFSGMMVAAFSGIIMSLSLYALRKSLGCERLRFKRKPWYKGFTGLYWHRYYPHELTFFGWRKA